MEAPKKMIYEEYAIYSPKLNQCVMAYVQTNIPIKQKKMQEADPTMYGIEYVINVMSRIREGNSDDR